MLAPCASARGFPYTQAKVPGGPAKRPRTLRDTVVAIFVKKKLIAELDIDSYSLGTFTVQNKRLLGSLLQSWGTCLATEEEMR